MILLNGHLISGDLNNFFSFSTRYFPIFSLPSLSLPQISEQV